MGWLCERVQYQTFRINVNHVQKGSRHDVVLISNVMSCASHCEPKHIVKHASCSANCATISSIDVLWHDHHLSGSLCSNNNNNNQNDERLARVSRRLRSHIHRACVKRMDVIMESKAVALSGLHQSRYLRHWQKLELTKTKLIIAGQKNTKTSFVVVSQLSKQAITASWSFCWFDVLMVKCHVCIAYGDTYTCTKDMPSVVACL